MNTENQLIEVSQLPNLHQADTSPRELSSEYWTPEKEGEYKVGVILEVKDEVYVNEQTGEEVNLPCAIILSQNEDLTFSTIRNGSKRLVATIEGAVSQGEIVPGKTPVKITFIGKAKNKTNGFLSDRWSVKPLIIK